MLLSQIHKKINFNFERQKLVFDSSRLLFSFAKIDDGTKALLNSLRKNPELNYNKILDLGCGYGVIGIFLKKSFPNSEVLCTDRDSLAVEFTEHNAKLNEVKIKTKSSLDFENIDGKFNLIICNFPAKLEKNGLKYFIDKSSRSLEKNGELALVIVKELNEEMQEIIKNEKIIVQFKDKVNGYFIYHLKFNEELTQEDFSYYTDKLEIDLEDKHLEFKTTDALREFDTPHFITELIIELLESKNFNKISIINPNQGMIPVAVAEICKPKEINLISRDLLQLEVSKENLSQNGFKNFNPINLDFIEDKTDLVIWSTQEEDFKEVSEKLELLSKNCKNFILGGKNSLVKQVLRSKNITPKQILQKGKYCAAKFQF